MTTLAAVLASATALGAAGGAAAAVSGADADPGSSDGSTTAASTAGRRPPRSSPSTPPRRGAAAALHAGHAARGEPQPPAGRRAARHLQRLRARVGPYRARRAGGVGPVRRGLAARAVRRVERGWRLLRRRGAGRHRRPPLHGPARRRRVDGAARGRAPACQRWASASAASWPTGSACDRPTTFPRWSRWRPPCPARARRPPVSVLAVHGTHDPDIPYGGTQVQLCAPDADPAGSDGRQQLAAPRRLRDARLPAPAAAARTTGCSTDARPGSRCRCSRTPAWATAWPDEAGDGALLPIIERFLDRHASAAPLVAAARVRRRWRCAAASAAAGSGRRRWGS